MATPTLATDGRPVKQYCSCKRELKAGFLKTISTSLNNGNKFPSSFESTVRKIFRQLVHVLTHIYRSHWQHLVELQLHPHFNTLVYHVMLFSKQFELVDARDSDMLEDLFQRLRQHNNATLSSSESITPACEVNASETQQLPDVQSQQPAAADQNTTELGS